MTHSFDAAAVATHYGISPQDLGIVLVPHELDGAAYESVLLFDKRQTQAVPGALVVPNFMGVRQQALQIAATTAGSGFAIFVADVYGRSVRPQTADEAVATIVPLKKNRAELRKRMNAALAAFQSQTAVKLTEVGAFGFCFGGTAVLELARSGAALKAFVSLHGGLDTRTPEDAKNIKGAVLVLHGALDPSVPREHVNAFIDEMSAADIDWQLVSYGEAAHSYSDPNANAPGYYYHEKTARRASLALRDFLAETLK